MKYVAVLVIAGTIYLLLGRPEPANPAGPVSTMDFLKSPLDRTHDVLKQARGRADDPGLQ
jgi:hypothetical protein